MTNSTQAHLLTDNVDEHVCSPLLPPGSRQPITAAATSMDSP